MILGIGKTTTLSASLEAFIFRANLIFVYGSSFFSTYLTVSAKFRTMESISLRTAFVLFAYCFLKSKEKDIDFLPVAIFYKLMERLYGGFGVWIRTGNLYFSPSSKTMSSTCDSVSILAMPYLPRTGLINTRIWGRKACQILCSLTIRMSGGAQLGQAPSWA